MQLNTDSCKNSSETICLNRHIFCVFLNVDVALIYVVMWRNEEWSTKSQMFRLKVKRYNNVMIREKIAE